ncbi:response regulator [Franconibacter helveticus]|uniref:response regulator n=1 Tax=Franconibacter helveticus TaxID=357240 RepID=UPI000DA19DBE|nr:response regulator [Franconibacter helveticus]
MKLLIVEDDLPLRESMALALANKNYEVVCVASAEEANALVRHALYRLIILDLSLPDQNGIALLSQWRRAGVGTPVLILTEQGALADRINGLDAGAEDYLTKPFEQDELWARVQSILQHSSAQKISAVDEPLSLLHSDDLVVNLETQQVTLKAQHIEITPREFAVLARLAVLPGETVSRESLLEKLCCQEETGSNTLEVHIHNLRRKLGKARIKTVRGVGYRLATEK